MTVGLSLAFPGGRSLGAWWRQLAPFHPRALWVTHLFLHRVELLVRAERVTRPDGFARLVLDALALHPAASLETLDGEFRLGPPILRHVLGKLTAAGLAYPDARGRWALTETGRQALKHGEYRSPHPERHAFYFLNHDDRPPEFLNLLPTAPLTAGPEGRPFDLAVLRECLTRPAEWKKQHAFPAEVTQILTPGGGTTDAEDEWRRVVLVQPIHLPAAVIQARAGHGPERLLGFAVRPKDWHLEGESPAFELDPAVSSLTPALTTDLPPEAWHGAWRSWAGAHGVPPDEADACAVERRDHRLLVTASRQVLDQLRAARGETPKGEEWLLAGEGATRAAVLLQAVTAGGKR